MKQLRLWLATAALAAPLSVMTSAGADCEGPNFTVRPKQAAVAAEVTILGSGWGDDCNDEGENIGCNEGALGNPLQDVEVVLERRGGQEAAHLGTVDANDDYDFELTTTIPDLPPGRYFIADRAERAPRIPLRIER